jgi:hypothetical protein
VKGLDMESDPEGSPGIKLMSISKLMSQSVASGFNEKLDEYSFKMQMCPIPYWIA